MSRYPSKQLKSKNISEDDRIVIASNYVKELATKEKCTSRIHSNTPTTCSCLYEILSPPDTNPLVQQVASYMCIFCLLNKAVIDFSIVQAIHAANAHAKHCSKPTMRKFVLPLFNNNAAAAATLPPEYQGPHMICQSAFMALLNIGKELWKRHRTSASNHTFMIPGKPIPHGLRNRKSNNAMKSDVEADLHAYFAELIQLATPRGDVNDSNSVTMVLPSTMSQRGLFKRWCYDRGHVVLNDAQGNQTTLERENEPGWPAGSVPKKIISWSSFSSFWKSNYPHVVIAKK